MMSLKKRILFVGHLPPPIHGVAVINEWIKNSAAINETFDVRFINLSFSDSVSSLRKFNLAKIFKIPTTLFKIVRTQFAFKPNVIIYNNSPEGIGFWRDCAFSLTIKAFKGRKTALVFYSHGKDYLDHSIQSFRYRLAARAMFRNTEIISLSSKLSEEYRFFPFKKIHILNNGIPDNSAPYINTHPKDVSFLFLSNFFFVKGILDFIEALHLLKQRKPDVKFTFALVGYDFDVTAKALTEMMKEKGLAEHLITIGPRLKEAKYKIIDQSKVLVLPTHYDIFPLVILEAFSFGVPVISTQVGGISEMIDDGVNGFCLPAGDIEKLYSSMYHFLNHPDDAATFGVQARKKFLQQYRFDIFEQNFNACMNSILLGNR